MTAPSMRALTMTAHRRAVMRCCWPQARGLAKDAAEKKDEWGKTVSNVKESPAQLMHDINKGRFDYINDFMASMAKGPVQLQFGDKETPLSEKERKINEEERAGAPKRDELGRDVVPAGKAEEEIPDNEWEEDNECAAAEQVAAGGKRKARASAGEGVAGAKKAKAEQQPLTFAPSPLSAQQQSDLLLTAARAENEVLRKQLAGAVKAEQWSDLLLTAARAENEVIREQLAATAAQLASLQPELVDLTADPDGSARAPQPSPPKVPSALAQLHGARQLKQEAVEDMQDEGQYAAQFIDKLQTKIDKLKLLAASAGADGAAIEEAVR